MTGELRFIEFRENKETELTSEELHLADHDRAGLVSIVRWSRSICSILPGT
jgi:hypothetical protein